MQSKFLYSLGVSGGIGTISQYSRNQTTGDLTEVGTPITYASADAADQIICESKGKFVYVFAKTTLSSGGNYSRLLQYAITQTTGELLPIGTGVVRVDACGGSGICIDGKGRWLYVTCRYSSTGNPPQRICVFTIDAITGALVVVGLPLSVSGSLFQQVTGTPLGNYLYMTHITSLNEISTWQIDQVTGIPTEISTRLVLGGNSKSLCHDGTGTFLYIATYTGTSGVTEYAINQTTGLLSYLGRKALATLSPYTICYDGIGKSIFATASSSQGIAKTLIGVTGLLTEITPETVFNHGLAPITSSGDNLFLYALAPDTNAIYGFSILLGELTPLAASFATATNPVALCSSASGLALVIDGVVAGQSGATGTLGGKQLLGNVVDLANVAGIVSRKRGLSGYLINASTVTGRVPTVLFSEGVVEAGSTVIGTLTVTAPAHTYYPYELVIDRTEIDEELIIESIEW